MLVLAFPQKKEKPEVIYIPYADTISQELVDYIRSRTKPYILSYHPDMRHLIPEMRCRIQRAKRIGVFSVSKDKQVSFSQGNLQYHRKRYEWRFADNQYDYIGAENIKDGQLADIIDLFGWSGKESKAPFGVNTSTNNADYAGEFLDWGTNEIQGDAHGVWRTLSIDEWEYILRKRNKANLLFSLGIIEGNEGLILLPDYWVTPKDIEFVPNTLPWNEKDKRFYDSTKYNHCKNNNYSHDEWIKMENAGAVFLPAAGYRTGSNVYSVQYSGYYWSAIVSTSLHAYCLDFNSDKTDMRSYVRDIGRSVRLVRDL